MKDFLKIYLGLFATTLILSGCADHFPVPGGTSIVNGACFSSVPEMQARLISLKPGMQESEVFANLCKKRESMSQLERREIRTALLGGADVLFAPNGMQTDAEIIDSLYGYKLSYRSVKKKIGFTSPIRIRTDEIGYDYTVTLIFQDGRLFERPILTGGAVNNASSGTLFDALTPGTLISRIPGP